MKLSILIPARNEKYLQQTVDDIFRHREGELEVLIGMDGEGSDLSFEKPLYEMNPKTNLKRAIEQQFIMRADRQNLNSSK